MKKTLTVEDVIAEAALFSEAESTYEEPSLYGVTDGKAVGTYLEHKFTKYLLDVYEYVEGNSASGIDLPGLGIDIKVTSERQPQSSCPFKSARQKIFGLGYHVLVFVYEKHDDHRNRAARLNMKHTIFVDKQKTADFQMTSGILKILENDGNEDDIVAFLFDKNLPVEEMEATNIAQAIMASPPQQGYLTISNALQWRLQYQRVINKAGEIEGILRVR